MLRCAWITGPWLNVSQGVWCKHLKRKLQRQKCWKYLETNSELTSVLSWCAGGVSLHCSWCYKNSYTAIVILRPCVQIPTVQDCIITGSHIFTPSVCNSAVHWILCAKTPKGDCGVEGTAAWRGLWGGGDCGVEGTARWRTPKCTRQVTGEYATALGDIPTYTPHIFIFRKGCPLQFHPLSSQKNRSYTDQLKWSRFISSNKCTTLVGVLIVGVPCMCGGRRHRGTLSTFHSSLLCT